ncbi:MAG: septum formation initiator family protein [bacterium]|nr:septum formation initiator family protein [bacterium]
MKKIGFFLVIVICFLVIQSLVRSIWTLWEKKDLLVTKQEELTRVKKRYEALKAQEKEVTNPQFAEKEIRDKLFLVKPDEKVVVLPRNVLAESAKQQEKKPKAASPYKQWISLFMTGKL